MLLKQFGLPAHYASMVTARILAWLVLLIPGVLRGQATGKSLVTIFREDQTIFKDSFAYRSGDFAPAGMRWQFYIDGRLVAVLQKNRFVTFEVSPGHHDFKFSNTDVLSRDVPAGSHAFLRPTPSTVGHRWAAVMLILDLPCGESRQRALSAHPLDRKNLYTSDTLEESAFPSCAPITSELTAR